MFDPRWTPAFRYIERLCGDARAVSRLRGEKLDHKCFIHAIKGDEHKFRRVNDLLEMRANLQEMRKVDHS